jgi:choline-sulfatase
VATPNLDRLAAEGVYEAEAETPYPLTTPAHATILSGFLPLQHGVLNVLGFRLAAGTPVLGEGFKAKGYATAAFVSSLTLDRRFGLAKGFDTYDQGTLGHDSAAASESPERDGAETTDAALSFLRAQKPEAPLFLWIHYYDLHIPYRKRADFDAKYPGRPYAAAVAFVDAEVGRVRSALESDPARSWRMVVVGDHGEGFLDHREATHGLTLYREAVHVPLLLWPKPERTIQLPRPWSLEDLAPTIRDWVGLPAAPRSDGRSLFAQAPAEERLLPSLTLQPAILFGVNPFVGIRRRALVYFRHGVEELYDLAHDPDERHDLSGAPSYRMAFSELRAATDISLPVGMLEKAAAGMVKEHSED